MIIGAGGFGRVSVDVVRARNAAEAQPIFDLIGVVDSAPSDVNLDRLAALGVPHLGSEDDWWASAPNHEIFYSAAVNSPKLRAKIVHRFSARGFRAAKLIHPHSIIGSNVILSEGVVICPGVIISTNATVGRHVHLNPASLLGHDSVLSDFVSVNPAASIAGNVIVESSCVIGAGAAILQELTVSEGAIIGAGAVVTKNVSANTVVKGVPAR